MANSRIYVQDSAEGRFVEWFKKLANVRKFGDPTQRGVKHGPQADKVQFETVIKYIETGKKSGGELLLGDETNRTLGQNTVHPVIFADQPEDSSMMKEEVFGPVLVINTFKTEEAVIAKANETEYGLYACLYTHNLERALRVSKKMESGMVSGICYLVGISRAAQDARIC